MPPAVPSSQTIRRTFLDFFAERGHTIVRSASLVPGNDPTLLFTNSGMVQFKDVFLGSGSRPYRRAVDSQKCMRVAGKHNDLEDVGRDDTHHTFFEMLGNWSFGDYYKAEAIPWAWQLLTEVWGLPRASLHATCFRDEKGEIPADDEAAEIWRAQPGFDPGHLSFFGRKENFWEMADVGPCGPDSEIHLDRGPEFCDRTGQAGHVCRVNGDCQRFLELWNLVFIQYNRTGPATLEPLPHKHVDTGMGFERLVSVLQGVRSNYDTDLFRPLLELVRRRLGHSESQAAELQLPYRVIADHGRAAAFLIADGVVPGNAGRNYVCRMVIRRASRYGGKAGFQGPFLAEVGRAVMEIYGEAYPELDRNREAIERTLTEEEERFQHTVDLGLERLEGLLSDATSRGQGTLDGRRAFDLYATYGLPLELTRDLARERGLEVDEPGFHQAMELHREASGGAGLPGADGAADTGLLEAFHSLHNAGRLPESGVRYDPYGPLEVEGEVLALLRDDRPAESLEAGEAGALVLPRTSFYVEAGGQVSDTGTIIGPDGAWEFRVEAMREPAAGFLLHTGRVVRGRIRAGDSAAARVDAPRRWDIMRNHTATHLLHASLRSVLGTHARQAGSLVAPDRLRFDFTHGSPLTEDELRRVQSMVAAAILENLPTVIAEKDRQEAEQEGAMALFGENYGERVRTISIGDGPRFSYELCGGTHVPRTGSIGPFVIVREESVGAGLRRIEALTGREAQAHLDRAAASLQQIAELVEAPTGHVEEQVRTLLAERDGLSARLAALQDSLARARFDETPVEAVGNAQAVIGLIPDCDADTLRRLSDDFRSRHASHVVVLGSAPSGKPLLIAAVSPDLVGRGVNAVDLVRHAGKAIGGGGGGRPTMAQAGGKDADGLPDALDLARRWVRDRLTGPGA